MMTFSGFILVCSGAVMSWCLAANTESIANTNSWRSHWPVVATAGLLALAQIAGGVILLVRA